MGSKNRLTEAASSIGASRIEIDAWTHRIGGLLERFPRLGVGLGRLENRALAEKLDEIPVISPIYVAGLARSGSTILLELLSRHSTLATHRYRDFPGVLMPWMWNWFVDRAGAAPTPEQERAHRDRISVTRESPEAFEEVVWMAFFDDLHASDRDALLSAATQNRPFESFYADHIRKMMLIRGGSRYLAKANYDISRLPYLLKLFPDARFVVPVRDPVWHVASLMKQHGLFCEAQDEDERVLAHFRRAGHFEFGLGRRAVAPGREGGLAAERLWQSGRDVEGWAALWTLVYGGLADMLASNPALRQATMIVPFESLCAEPGPIFGEVLEHCGLSPEHLIEEAERIVSPPDYYAPEFSADELAAIRQITEPIASRLGYGAGGAPDA